MPLNQISDSDNARPGVSAKWIVYSITAGIIWGLVSMIVNALTNAFLFEDTVLRNIVAFSSGGAIFGLVNGGLLMVIRDRLPFKGIVPKAIFLSTGLWGILRMSGFILSSVDSERYHAVLLQTIQGLFLAVMLGGILGVFWKIEER